MTAWILGGSTGWPGQICRLPFDIYARLSFMSLGLSSKVTITPPRVPGTSKAPDKGTGPAKLRPLTILIVDDVLDTCRMYAGYFEFVGAKAITAGDGVEALQAIYQHKPDAVLLDLAMPRMTGWETLESLRRDPALRDLAVVVITGQITSGAHERALAGGADLFLTKPCLPHVVFSFIVQLLRNGGAQTPPRNSA
jgi:CheY-like chemotaxis protein